MAYPYATGDKLLASEYNEVVKAAGPYAADAGSNDSYAITVTPAPSSYVTGMVFHFKANTANTGAATLNVNGLGARSILRPDGSALADGDIAAGQIVVVIYNGTSFLMLSPVANAPVYKNGTATRDLSLADATQTIAHGLGRIPRRVRIRVLIGESGTTSGFEFCDLVYNGTTASSIYNRRNSSANQYGTGTTIIIGDGSNGTGFSTGTVTFDATNISIAWVKTNTPNATAQIVWEAEA